MRSITIALIIAGFEPVLMVATILVIERVIRGRWSWQ